MHFILKFKNVSNVRLTKNASQMQDIVAGEYFAAGIKIF